MTRRDIQLFVIHGSTPSATARPMLDYKQVPYTEVELALPRTCN